MFIVDKEKIKKQNEERIARQAKRAQSAEAKADLRKATKLEVLSADESGQSRESLPPPPILSPAYAQSTGGATPAGISKLVSWNQQTASSMINPQLKSNSVWYNNDDLITMGHNAMKPISLNNLEYKSNKSLAYAEDSPLGSRTSSRDVHKLMDYNNRSNETSLDSRDEVLEQIAKLIKLQLRMESKLDDEVRSLKTAIRYEMDTLRREVNEKVAAIDSNLHKYITQTAELNKVIGSRMENHEKRLATIENSFDTLENRVESSIQQTVIASNKCEEQVKSVEEFKRHIATVCNETSQSVHAKCKQSSAVTNNLQERMTNLETVVNNMNHDINDLEDKVDDLRTTKSEEDISEVDEQDFVPLTNKPTGLVKRKVKRITEMDKTEWKQPATSEYDRKPDVEKKLHINNFSGNKDEDVLTWLAHLKQALDMYQIKEENKTSVASLYLRGYAQTQFQALAATGIGTLADVFF